MSDELNLDVTPELEHAAKVYLTIGNDDRNSSMAWMDAKAAPQMAGNEGKMYVVLRLHEEVRMVRVLKAQWVHDVLKKYGKLPGPEVVEVEHHNTAIFVIGGQTFYPMMLPKGNSTKEERVVAFRGQLTKRDIDPSKGTLHYCEEGDAYGFVFLPEVQGAP